MKSLMSLVQEVLIDLGTWCGVSTAHDYNTIVSRSKDEGLSFLTITLPTFAADLQKGLEQEEVDSQLFQGFRRGRGGLPLFLGGFLDLVFDRKTGRLLADPSHHAIFAIRQLTLLFSKINLPCSSRRKRKAIEKYLKNEMEVKRYDRESSSDLKDEFLRLSTIIWGAVLSYVDQQVYDGQTIPRHGPGSTADRLLANNKYRQREWTQRLEGYFPSGEFIYPNWRHYDASELNLLEPGAERPVRVITVPKTLKTPRIIAIEPTCMQYVQQGIARELMFSIPRLDNQGWRVGSSQELDRTSFVGFSDQTRNQNLALEGSLNGSLATLDLSDASDRVSNQHVRLLLRHHPHLRDAVDACRSRKADVPGHGVIRLAKFASMGSALTFPFEAMIFTVIVFLGIESKLKRRLTLKDVQSFRGRVRIYGDDIIVPVEFAESVVGVLHTFGYKVNTGKSYWNGKFRESCGKEYYSGHDVSVVKVRQLLPTQRRDAQELISTVSLRNLFYKRGLWRAARHLDQLLGRIIPFPAVGEKSPVLGRHSFLGFDTERMCPNLHRPLVRGAVVRSVPPESPLGGCDALMKWFLKLSDLPFANKDHLERSGRPLYVRTTIGLAPAY